MQSTEIMTIYEYIHKHNVSFLELAERLDALDHSCIGNLTPEKGGAIQQWAEKHSMYPELCRLLVADGKIAGYWSGLLLNDDDHGKLIQGTLLDANIDISKCRHVYSTGGKLYITMVAIRAGSRGFTSLKTLVTSLAEFVMNSSKNGFVITSISANAHSKEGEMLCTGFGMRRVCKNIVDTGYNYTIDLPTEIDIKVLSSIDFFNRCKASS
jgi:hypothetical protein